MIELVTAQNYQDVLGYLQAHEEYCQFLINNLELYGAKLTDHHNSGNYKVIYQDGKIVGVFCLTKRGNLLTTSPLMNPKKFSIH